MGGKQYKTLSLDTIDNGALPELYEKLQAEVMANIADPNTSPKAKREVVLKIAFKPAEDRSAVAIEVTPSVKLASVRPSLGLAHLVRDGLTFVPMVENVQQDDLLAALEQQRDTPPAGVIPFGSAASA